MPWQRSWPGAASCSPGVAGPERRPLRPGPLAHSTPLTTTELLPDPPEPRAQHRVGPGLRLALPAGLLVLEYLFLSFLVDLPTSGPAIRFVHAVRLAVPVILGTVAAGWMLKRGTPARTEPTALPPWRPWPAAALQPVAFAITAALAYAVFREGAPPPSTAMVALVLACATTAGVMALWIFAPPSWFLAVLLKRWAYPLLAIAVGVLAWRAAAAAEELWGVLSETTLRGTAALLRLLTTDVTIGPEPDGIQVGDFGVIIAPICSGADGLGLVALFQATWIALARERLRVKRALLLIPLGMAVAFGANLFRIAILLWVGAAGHVELATGGLHSKLGWILFIGIALGTIAIAERIPWFARPGEGRTGAALPPAAAAYVAPLLAALFAALVTSIWSEDSLDRWYLARIVAAAGVLWLVRRELPAPSITFSWPPVVAAAITCAAWVALVPVDAAAGAVLGSVLHDLGAVERWTWIAGRVVGSCLVIPVVEELAFRGFLLKWLVSPEFEHIPPRAWTWPAVLVSSLAFGVLHGHWVLGTFAGMVFAAVLLVRGRLSDAILAHALTNAGIAFTVLAFGRWDLWA